MSYRKFSAPRRIPHGRAKPGCPRTSSCGELKMRCLAWGYNFRPNTNTRRDMVDVFGYQCAFARRWILPPMSPLNAQGNIDSKSVIYAMYPVLYKDHQHRKTCVSKPALLGLTVLSPGPGASPHSPRMIKPTAMIEGTRVVHSGNPNCPEKACVAGTSLILPRKIRCNNPCRNGCLPFPTSRKIAFNLTVVADAIKPADG